MASFYKSIVEATSNQFEKAVKKRAKELNTFKANVNDPARKMYTSYPTHKLIFMKTFGSNCEGIYPNFTITSLERIAEIFGGIAVATPICYFEHDVNKDILRGDICIPISTSTDSTHSKVFLPGSCDY